MITSIVVVFNSWSDDKISENAEICGGKFEYSWIVDNDANSDNDDLSSWK